MAKKTARKRGKTGAKKKAPVRRKVVSVPERKPLFSGLKIRLVVRNLIALVLLTIISYILYLISQKELYISFFGFAAAILGFISLALFVVLLILVLLRLMRR